MAIATVLTRPNSHLFLSVYSASSVVKKNYFSTVEAKETQSQELANEEAV